MKLKTNDWVYIEWWDSVACGRKGWKDQETINDLTVAPLHSIGVVHKANDHEITVASHWDDEGDNIQGEMCIPRCAVKKIKRLKL